MDLNDLKYYAAIVESGSLSSASRMLGVTKSLLSQHLSRLEQSLGVCLIQRTTRRLQVTPLGQDFYRSCLAVMNEVERARALVDDARTTPRGRLKVSCPVLFAQTILIPVVSSFLQSFPEVELMLDADYRDVDILGEGYDLMLKIQRQLEDSRLTVRAFALDRHWLVAAPELIERIGLPQVPADLAGVASVALRIPGDNHRIWNLFDASEIPCTIAHHPRLTCSDPLTLMHATISGSGVALLPGSMCIDKIATGHLVRLLPEYQGATMYLHAIYPSRQRLNRAARCFLDHLARYLPAQIHDMVGEEFAIEPPAFPGVR